VGSPATRSLQKEEAMRVPRRREPPPPYVDAGRLSTAELLQIANAAPTDPLSQSALERDAWRVIAVRGGVRAIDSDARSGSGIRT
jgi:hypothetical protein